MAVRTVWHDKPICPVCGARVLRTQSHSSPAPTFRLHHLACWQPQPAAKQPPQQEQLFPDA